MICDMETFVSALQLLLKYTHEDASHPANIVLLEVVHSCATDLGFRSAEMLGQFDRFQAFLEWESQQ